MKNISRFKVIGLMIIAISIVSCKDNEKKISEENSTIENMDDNSKQMDQDVNKMIDDPENEGEKMMLGNVNEEGFKNNDSFPWMQEGFEEYKPNTSKIKEIRNLMEGMNLKIFMGTWCEDSQREIPRLYKILHTIDYNFSNMEIVAVSHDKDTPSGIEKGFNLEYVPTIIFLKDGNELNRIVEYTQGETLEDDIITILKGKPYTPAYAE